MKMYKKINDAAAATWPEMSLATWQQLCKCGVCGGCAFLPHPPGSGLASERAVYFCCFWLFYTTTTAWHATSSVPSTCMVCTEKCVPKFTKDATACGWRSSSGRLVDHIFTYIHTCIQTLVRRRQVNRQATQIQMVASTSRVASAIFLVYSILFVISMLSFQWIWLVVVIVVRFTVIAIAIAAAYPLHWWFPCNDVASVTQ